MADAAYAPMHSEPRSLQRAPKVPPRTISRAQSTLVQHTALCRAWSGRMLLLKTELFQTRRNALRKDDPKLSRRRRRNSAPGLLGSGRKNSWQIRISAEDSNAVDETSRTAENVREAKPAWTLTNAERAPLPGTVGRPKRRASCVFSEWRSAISQSQRIVH